MKKLLSSGLLVLVVLCFEVSIPSLTHASGSENILIIFDASGSMKDQLGGQAKIDFAKADAQNLISSIDPSILIGLRPLAYTKQSTKTAACVDTSLVQSFTTNRSVVGNAISNLQAVGLYTPIAYTLQQSANDFTPGNNNVVILLTDGQENCGGDPSVAAAALKAAGINVKTYVIGLGVDATTKLQLQSVAQSGGGQYYDANDSASLSSSFTAILTAEKPIDKTNTDSLLGAEVTGGNGYETAVPITPGMYHLSHYQLGSQYDYFKMDVNAGDIVNYSIQSSESEPSYDPKTNTFSDGNNHNGSYAGIGMYTATRAKLDYLYEGTASKVNTHDVTITDGGTIYFLVGNEDGHNDVMSKSDIFTIKVTSATPAVTVQATPPAGVQDGTSQNSYPNQNDTIPTNVSNPTDSSSTQIPDVGGFFKNLPYIGIAVVIAAIILVILFILLIVHLIKNGNKKKSNTTMTQNMSQPTQPISQPTTQQSTTQINIPVPPPTPPQTPPVQQ